MNGIHGFTANSWSVMMNGITMRILYIMRCVYKHKITSITTDAMWIWGSRNDVYSSMAVFLGNSANMLLTWLTPNKIVGILTEKQFNQQPCFFGR